MRASGAFATYQEYQLAVQGAFDDQRPNLAGAIMVAWEWSLREPDVIENLLWTDYRGRLHPDKMKVCHGKNDSVVWMPLEDDAGELLFPEIEALFRLLPRHGTLMFMADRENKSGNVRPFTEDRLRKDARAVLDGIGLTHLSFASFRKGGETEMGDARLTDTQITALDGHKGRSELPVYVVTNQLQRLDAARQRREHRTNRGQLSGWEADLCRDAKSSQVADLSKHRKDQ